MNAISSTEKRLPEVDVERQDINLLANLMKLMQVNCQTAGDPSGMVCLGSVRHEDHIYEPPQPSFPVRFGNGMSL